MTSRVMFSLSVLLVAAVIGCGGGPSVPDDPRAEGTEQHTLVAQSVRESTLDVIKTVREMQKSPEEASMLGEFCGEQTAGFEQILDDAGTDDPHRPTYERLLDAWKKVPESVGSPALEEALKEVQVIASSLPEQSA